MSTTPFVKISPRGKLQTFASKTWVAVLDQRTDLVYPRAPLPQRYNYAAALEQEKTFDLLGTGWTVPEVEPLFLLPGRSRYPAVPDPRYFDCPVDWYWTRTPVAWSPGSLAWVVDFGSGNVDGRRYYEHRVLLARPRQSLGPRSALSRRLAARPNPESEAQP